MHKMEDLKYKLCKELEEYAEKQKMSAGDLEIIHKLSDTIKNLAKIEMLDEDGGYSEAGGHYYGDGNSYARGGRGRGRNARRDNMGRYSREGVYNDGKSYRGGYSRDGAKDYMIRQIEDMMDDAESPKEREALQRCLHSLEMD